MSPEMLSVVMSFLDAIKNNEPMSWQSFMPYLEKAANREKAFEFSNPRDPTIINPMDFNIYNPFNK